ncbi:MAG: TPM domain-containing protein [Rubrivivax sp.]|nr:TPM domain-containing protein [Rubrivivax sp.]
MGWLQRIRRLLKHRWLDEDDAARALGAPALARLEARVAASEQAHSGEIRLCIEAGLPLSYLWRDATPRQRAVTMFGKLRVWDTEHNNGVLIYLLLAEHAIEIVADRGLARHVPQAQWDALLGGMREAFRAGRYEEGLAAAVDRVDALLRQHFPLAPGQANPNELPNRADLR